MNTESNAAPDVAADTATSEKVANEVPEVAAPESSTEEQGQQTEKPEQDDSDKSLKRLQRRVDRVTAARYQAEARAQQLEEQLARYQRQAQPEADNQFKPEEIDSLVSSRAEQIATAREVDRRGAEISRELAKLAGSEKAVADLIEAITEEAGPFIDQRTGKWTPLGEAIDDSQNPAGLIKHLGQNPDIAESLRGLTPAQLGRRIALIESQMTKPEPKPSKAPLPLEPVKASGKVQKSPSEMTDTEFAAYRRAQIAKRR